MARTKVGILVFEDVEVLDFAGPFEVFSVTRLEEKDRQDQRSPFKVFLVSQSDGSIHATGGLEIVPSFSFKNCPDLDILVIPGGVGHSARTLQFTADRLDFKAEQTRSPAGFRLYRLHPPGLLWHSRWPTGHHPLEVHRLDAGTLSSCHG